MFFLLILFFKLVLVKGKQKQVDQRFTGCFSGYVVKRMSILAHVEEIDNTAISLNIHSTDRNSE